MKSKPIALAVPSSVTESIVKRSAVTTFKLLRKVQHQARTLPGLVQQAVKDVREAWEETSHPNV